MVQCLVTVRKGIETCWPLGRGQRKGNRLSEMELVASACGAALQNNGVCVCGEKKTIENNSIIGWLKLQQRLRLYLSLSVNLQNRSRAFEVPKQCSGCNLCVRRLR